jgi:predicted PurR-regulated permease PerM
MNQARSASLFNTAVLLLLGYLLWKIFSPFLESIAWAAVLAAILYPAHRWILKRIHRPNAAAAVSTLLTLILVVGPAVTLGITLLVQGVNLYQLTTDYFSKHKIGSLTDLMNIPILNRVVERIVKQIPVTAQDLQSWILDGLKTFARAAAGFLSSAALGFLGFLLSFFIMLITLFFFFRDGANLWRQLLGAVPLPAETTSTFAERLKAVFRAVVIGMLSTALIQGLLGGIGFAIFGLPSPLVFGGLMFVFSLLPIGGTAIVWLPAAVILMSMGAIGRGVGLLLWGALIVGLVDNWFKPMIISGRTHMNTLPVLFGVMGGIAAFGFLGVFVGPMVVSMGLALWEMATHERPT